MIWSSLAYVGQCGEKRRVLYDAVLILFENISS